MVYLIIMSFGRASIASGVVVSYETEEAAQKCCDKMNADEEGVYTYRVEKMFHIKA